MSRRRPGPVAAAGLLAVALAGCTDGSPGTAPTAEANTTGGRPQVALVTSCLGECSYTAPLGLPEVALYADGLLVHADRTGTDSRPVLRSTRLDRRDLAAIQRLAVAAGLEAGGDTTLAPAAGRSGADGSRTVVTARLRGTVTTVRADQLDSDEEEQDRFADADRAAKVAALIRALRERAAEADEPLAVTTHVVVATQAAQDPAADAWPGPRLGTFPAVSSTQRCGLVTGAERDAVAAAVDADGFGGRYRDGGATWQVVGRVLLPHEDNCRDVLETAAQGTSAATAPAGS